MDNWREVLHIEVYGILITASIRDDVNLFTFKNAEEANLIINKIKGSFETFNGKSVLENFLGPIE